LYSAWATRRIGQTGENWDRGRGGGGYDQVDSAGGADDVLWRMMVCVLEFVVEVLVALFLLLEDCGVVD